MYDTHTVPKMESFQFASGNPLKVRKRKERDEGNDNEFEDQVVQQGFQNEHRFTKKNKKEEAFLAGYQSDSSGGYDSDFENKPEFPRDSRKPNGLDKVDDDDIFASDEAEDEGNRPNLQRDRQIRVLDIDQFNKDNLPEHDTDSERQLPYVENNAVKIEAFNIEEEAKHGIFDLDGNYIEAEEDADDAVQDQDLWIEDFNDVKNVAMSKQQNAALISQKQRELQKQNRHYMIDEALIRLQYFLSGGDTVMNTLANLNKLRKAQEKKKQGPVPGDTKDYIRNAIDFISDLSAILEQKGVEDVYFLTRHDITILIHEESLSGSAVVDNCKTKLWSFKWINKQKEVHGLFTNYQMQHWKQSYFNHNVIVKFLDEPDEKRNWLHIDCITFI